MNKKIPFLIALAIIALAIIINFIDYNLSNWGMGKIIIFHLIVPLAIAIPLTIPLTITNVLGKRILYTKHPKLIFLIPLLNLILTVILIIISGIIVESLI